MTANKYPHLNATFLRGTFKGQVESLLKTRVSVIEYALPDDSPEHLKIMDFLAAVDAKDILIPEGVSERTMEKFNWIRFGVQKPSYWDLPKLSAPPAWYETFYAGIQVDPAYNYAKTMVAMGKAPKAPAVPRAPKEPGTAPDRPAAAAKPAKAKKEVKAREPANIDTELQYPFHSQLDIIKNKSGQHKALWLNHHNANPELERSALTKKQCFALAYMSRETGIPLKFPYSVIE